MTALPQTRSLLPVVAAADNFPAHLGPYPLAHPLTSEPYVPFHLHPTDAARGLPPVGLLRPAVLRELLSSKAEALAADSSSPWNFVQNGDKVVAVTFSPEVLKKGREGMEEAMRVTVEKWRNNGKFPEALGGWRNERYTIYAWPASQALVDQGITPGKPFGNAAFGLERSACAVWGFATFGVHMTGKSLTYEGDGADMKIWVPRRSKTKATWPGMLDNTVAGGIPDGYSPLEAMVKECDEEASLPDHFVRPRLRNVGACTYFYITTNGDLQPELEYTYDLPLPPRDSPEYILPGPHDDEVESFTLMTVPEVIEAMHQGKFKPNCGLILVDFLIRHGLVTPENEPYFFEIMWRAHRRLGVTVPT